MATAAAGKEEQKTSTARSAQMRPEPRRAIALRQKNRVYAIVIAFVFALIFVTVMILAVSLRSFEAYLGVSGL